MFGASAPNAWARSPSVQDPENSTAAPPSTTNILETPKGGNRGPSSPQLSPYNLDGASDTHCSSQSEVHRSLTWDTSRANRDCQDCPHEVASHIQSRSSSTANNEIDVFSSFKNPFQEHENLGVERQSSGFSDSSAYIRTNAFAKHRDTLARLRLGELTIRRLPPSVLGRMLSLLSIEDYKNMRLVSRSWATALTIPEPIKNSLFLPTEILQEIFSYLQPCDFDAARHTCRSWFLASLDRKLGHTMLRKAGCQLALQADIDSHRQFLQSDDAQIDMEVDRALIDDRWLISKRLAIESKLSPAWHGSGLDGDRPAQMRMTIHSTFDFNQLAINTAQDLSQKPRFTVSTCQKFVLALSDCNVFVYRFSETHSLLQPVAKIIAESTVLAVSMDTSSGRYAIAALLKDRVGACWDIDDAIAQEHVLQDSSAHSSLPVYNQPSAVYRNLGNARDPPRSVAICPQRRCVAFGRKSGIQLYWVDALTGRDLSRWFPLAAPSDHLYFLPHKPGVGSSKKLRLISSAANPRHVSTGYEHELAPDWSCVTSLTGQGRKRSMTRLFFGSLPFPSGATTQTSFASADQPLGSPEILRAGDCDHYRAVPLSDGIHMLFTDPVTGFLCLGSDAPLGGPTKFIRKICMVPPSRFGNIPNSAPICYAAGQDMSWGVRVVAAYDDGSIVLYNIPSDCFERVRHVRSDPDIWEDINGVYGESDLLMDFFMQTRTNVNQLAGADGEATTSSFRSVLIDGALLGEVESNVANLAVDTSHGGLHLWAFLANGKATHMSISSAKYGQIQSNYADASGVFHVGSPMIGTRKTRFDELDNGLSAAGTHIRFFGLDGCCDKVTVCGPVEYNHEFGKDLLHPDEGISMTPPESDSDDDESIIPQQIELLTDWCRESLLRPYIVNVPDIRH